MSHQINDKKLFLTELRGINLRDFSCNGRILDIGGGGEGVISQICPQNVIAIDLSKEELLEAEDGAVKIIMDAAELKFIDRQFEIATSFFTLYYIKEEKLEKVFKEVYRVLKDGGEFHIWDAEIPPYPGGEKDVYVIRLEILLSEKIIKTGYGVLWPENGRSLEKYVKLAKKTGFKVEFKKREQEIINLVLKK